MEYGRSIYVELGVKWLLKGVFFGIIIGLFMLYIWFSILMN